MSFLDLVESVTTPHSKISDVPLFDPDLVLLMDCFYLRNDVGKLVVGYVVHSQFKIFKAFFLPAILSAQPAELVLLMLACTFTLGKSINVYTDSQYAFNACHSTGQICKHRGFITSCGPLIWRFLWSPHLRVTISYYASYYYLCDALFSHRYIRWSKPWQCMCCCCCQESLDGSPAIFLNMAALNSDLSILLNTWPNYGS